jgi:hypothetical protein
MRLTDHVTSKYNSVSTAEVFVDFEKASDTTWHPGFLYKLSKLQFSASKIKLISSFFADKKFRISIESEMSTPQDYKQGGATRFHPVPYPVQFVYK